MKDRLIHPTGWDEYLRYAHHGRSADWRPPLVTFAVAKLRHAAETLTPRQLGLFVLFVCGYTESPLLDAEAGHLSAREFIDRPATWKRRVGEPVTSADKDAWMSAGLIKFTTVEEPLTDDPPTADEPPELEHEPQHESGRGHDREEGREQETEQEHGREREHEDEHDAEPQPGRERVNRKGRFLTSRSKRSSEHTKESQGVVCPECGKTHHDGLPGDPRSSFICQINAAVDHHSLEEINAYRQAAGKKPWVWDEN